MKILSLLVKILSLLSLALSLLVNIGLGIVVFYVLRLVKHVQKIVALKTNGTRIMATVTGFNDVGRSSKPKDVPQKIYFLVATWQHPETGKMYTFKAPVLERDKFPIGSLVPFLVDYQNPGIYWLEGTLDTFMRPANETPSAEE